MKAMILAAGLGTRLQPLTNDKPKALVEAGGVTLLELMIKKLIGFGFDEVIVNVHHFADQIIEFFKAKNNFNIRIEISDERDELLDTGGGIKNAGWFFNDQNDFLVINVDVITDIDLGLLMEYHLTKEALVTIAVRDRQTQRYFLFDKNIRLCGWMNKKSDERRVVRDEQKNLKPLAFSGIHVINPEIFNLMNYLDLAKENKIYGYQHDNTTWVDVGKKEQLDQLSEM